MVVFLSGYPCPCFSDFSWKRLYNHSKFYPDNSYQKRGQNTWSWGVRIYQEIDRTGLRRSQGFCTTCFDWTGFVCTFWHQDNQIPWSCWHYTHLVRISNHNSLKFNKTRNCFKVCPFPYWSTDYTQMRFTNWYFSKLTSWKTFSLQSKDKTFNCYDKSSFYFNCWNNRVMVYGSSAD